MFTIAIKDLSHISSFKLHKMSSNHSYHSWINSINQQSTSYMESDWRGWDGWVCAEIMVQYSNVILTIWRTGVGPCPFAFCRAWACFQSLCFLAWFLCTATWQASLIGIYDKRNGRWLINSIVTDLMWKKWSFSSLWLHSYLVHDNTLKDIGVVWLSGPWSTLGFF
jgi:hypothetical protein